MKYVSPIDQTIDFYESQWQRAGHTKRGRDEARTIWNDCAAVSDQRIKASGDLFQARNWRSHMFGLYQRHDKQAAASYHWEPEIEDPPSRSGTHRRTRQTSGCFILTIQVRVLLWPALLYSLGKLKSFWTGHEMRFYLRHHSACPHLRHCQLWVVGFFCWLKKTKHFDWLIMPVACFCNLNCTCMLQTDDQLPLRVWGSLFSHHCTFSLLDSSVTRVWHLLFAPGPGRRTEDGRAGWIWRPLPPPSVWRTVAGIHCMTETKWLVVGSYDHDKGQSDAVQLPPPSILCFVLLIKSLNIFFLLVR